MTTASSLFLDQIEYDGFAIVENVLDHETVCRLREAMKEVEAPQGVSRRQEVYAIRNLLDTVPAVRRLAESEPVLSLIRPILGANCFAVRGLFFDKVAGANWRVPWHQDISIAVREHQEVPGFQNPSTKAGVPHIQPPPALLERMLSIRLHLDECNVDNGPLRVLPGTHRQGKLTADGVSQLRTGIPEVACLLPEGGALLMRPLLLHASSPATTPGHRRVIHLEYAAEPLPHGLEWHETVNVNTMQREGAAT